MVKNIPGVDKIPCECRQGYIGQTAQRIIIWCQHFSVISDLVTQCYQPSHSMVGNMVTLSIRFHQTEIRQHSNTWQDRLVLESLEIS